MTEFQTGAPVVSLAVLQPGPRDSPRIVAGSAAGTVQALRHE